MGPGRREDSLAKALARELHGTVPQITGAGLTDPIAYRWKTQINENAKLPAFCGELPELDHNEIVGWTGAQRARPVQRGVPRRLRLHPGCATDRADPALIAAHARVDCAGRELGETRLERLVSLVLLGDLVSCYMAVLPRSTRPMRRRWPS